MTVGERYTESFYDARDEGSRASAETILPIVFDLIHVESAIDVGCATGTWVEVLARHTDDVVGIDGEWVPMETRGSWFQPRNLEQPLLMDRRFDLAISMEVAEHLSPERADGFVMDLVKLADAILFSAAIPGQGGEHHRNEQWQSYWAERFRSHGFYPHDLIRPKVWESTVVDAWYAQNTLLYLRSPTVPGPLDLVHPRVYGAAVDRSVQAVIRRMTPRKVVRKLRRRIMASAAQWRSWVTSC